MKNLVSLLLLLAVSLSAAAQKRSSQKEQSKTKKEAVAPIIIEEEDQGHNDLVYPMVEEMPKFPGGEEELYKYLVTNLRFPQQAKVKGFNGIVYVTFVINEDGSISDVKVLRGIGMGCDEEAVRVVKSMPSWEPGKQRGKPVKVQYNLPVRFKYDGEPLQNKEEAK